MPMKIVRNDITKMSVDAIVNAANIKLQMGGGVCGAIFSAAGAEKLQEECDSIGTCDVGQAVITRGYSLFAKHIIHTVGPIWRRGNSDEAKLLYSCYKSSLTLALQHKCKAIAFPLISSGIYGYPKDAALQIAISAIGEFLLDHEMLVYLVVYDKSAYVLSEKLFSEIEKYIDDNYVEEHLGSERNRNIASYESQQIRQSQKSKESLEFQELQELQESKESANILEDYSPCDASSHVPSIKRKRSLKDVMSEIEESFSEGLMRLIDEKGMTDVET